MLSTSPTLFDIAPDRLVEGVVEVPGHPVTRLGRGAIQTLDARAESAAIIGSARAVASAALSGRVFSDFTPNPTPAQVSAAAAYIEAVDARCVVGVGGGSAMDLAKAAALAARGGGRRLTLVQVPTTAGTGAEVTPFGSIWPPDGPKYSVDDPQARADLAVVDWTLSASQPPGLTAITGLDALVHAFETTIGQRADERARRHAQRGLRLIGAHLPAAVAASTPGPTPLSRAAMSLAATHAGRGLAVSRSAAAHALSYTLTARFGVPHGLAVALLCQGLMPLQRRLAPAACARAEGALGAPIDAFIADIIRAAGLPDRLRAFGVAPADLPRFAAEATRSIRLANNPGPPTAAELTHALGAVR